ncbi:MAG: hypothetical protein ABI675_30100 [Chitinophagaceae bacterium]
MKKLFIFFVFTCMAFIAQAQSNPAKVTAIKPVNIIKTIPSSKAVVIRKDVVKLKGQLVQLNDSISVTKKEIDALVDKMKNDLDSMSEMGEMESLRLQMAMDRLSKVMNTLSNILKKIGDTQKSITQNIK